MTLWSVEYIIQAGLSSRWGLAILWNCNGAPDGRYQFSKYFPARRKQLYIKDISVYNKGFLKLFKTSKAKFIGAAKQQKSYLLKNIVLCHLDEKLTLFAY